MQRLKFFSGIKPSLEDLEFEQQAKEAGILNRQREMFTDGVVWGLQLVLSNGSYLLQPGVAYISGERIKVPYSVQIPVNLSELPRFLFLKYSQLASQTVTHFVTGEEHQIYRSDSFDIVLKAEGSLAADILLIAAIDSTGITDQRVMLRLAVDERLHAPNHDLGTSAAEFRVGLGDPRHPAGLRALTEIPTPKPPLNVRITALRPDYRHQHDASPFAVQLSPNLNLSSGYAQVFLAWELSNVSGNALSSNLFRIDSPMCSFAADQLQGYYLTFASGEEFYIHGNNATTDGQTLITVQGDLQGLSADQQPAMISAGATEYRFSAIPVDANEGTPISLHPTQSAPPLGALPLLLSERREGLVSAKEPSCMLQLPLGRRYIFQVQAVRGMEYSPPKVMTAGNYLWQGQQISYSSPFLVALPSLGTAALNLTPLPSNTGFTAEITGWNEAELLEYGWKLVSDQADLTIDLGNPSHHPGVTTHHRINILTADDLLEHLSSPSYAAKLLNAEGGMDTTTRLSALRRRYKFAVRPLIGGQVVAEVVTGIVTLRLDPYVGQAALVGAIQDLTRNLDLLNKSVRNLDAIRSAQAARVEDQLMTLNSAVEAGQQYAQFSVADINLPFPEVSSDIPLLGRDRPDGARLFQLDPELSEQTFAHQLGHLNYIVQVRDADGIIVDAEIDLNENDVVIRLSEAMAGTVIIIDGQSYY